MTPETELSTQPTPEAKPGPKAGAGVRATASAQSAVSHRVEVQVDAERVGQAFERAYRELARQVRVKGFRPGKAPRSVLERLYGASIVEEIESQLVRETLPDAIEQTALEPVAPPSIDAETPRPNQAFTYTAVVEIAPKIELGNLSGLPARRPRVAIEDAEVEAELEQLRLRHAPLLEEPAGTPAENGHTLSIDFVGRVDGAPFEGGSGRDVELEIGSGRFIEGFEAQLVGVVAGEDRPVRVTFPTDYDNTKLAGKQAEFDVHVATLKKRQLPDLDDEFAKDVGDFETLAALRARIRADLTELRENAARAALHHSLLDALIERTPFDVPSGLVEQQLDQELHAAAERMQGAAPEAALRAQLERWREEWRGAAERRVRERLLLEAVAADQSLEVAEEEIEAHLAQLAAREGVDRARLEQALGQDGALRLAKRHLLPEKALDFLVSLAKVEETADS
jgi:trigger factor